MSLSKKDIKDLKIYRVLKFKKTDLDGVLLPYKGADKIPDEELIANKVPKWCEPGDPLYEFLSEQIRKKNANSGVIFCPYVPPSFLKDPENQEKEEK